MLYGQGPCTGFAAVATTLSLRTSEVALLVYRAWAKGEVQVLILELLQGFDVPYDLQRSGEHAMSRLGSAYSENYFLVEWVGRERKRLSGDFLHESVLLSHINKSLRQRRATDRLRALPHNTKATLKWALLGLCISSI